MRILKNILYYTTMIAMGLFVLISILVHVFEDDIKQYALDKLNENLTVPVTVDQIEFSIWKRFPHASLEFRNVYIADAWPNGTSRDTFFFASALYMDFNVLDMISGSYKVDRIEGINGVVKVKYDKLGESNTNIWKPSEDSSDDEDFTFKLSEVKLENFRFRYANQLTDQVYEVDVNSAVLDGEFYRDAFVINGNLATNVRRIRNQSISILRNKKAALHCQLAVDQTTDKYTFNQGQLNVEGMNFNLNGWVRNDSITSCDLKLEGENVSMAAFIESLSKNVSSGIAQYTSTGEVDFKSTIVGNISPSQSPVIAAQFHYTNGKVREPSSGVELTDVNLVGSFTNFNDYHTDELTVERLTATLPDGAIDASFTLQDFGNPYVDGKVKANLNLKTVQEFLKLSSVNRIQGNLKVNTELVARFNNPKNFETRNISISKSNGEWRVDNVSLQLRESPMQFENLSGAIVLKGNDAAVKNFTGRIGSSDINFSGGFKNLIPYILFDKETLHIIASLSSKNFKLEDILGDSDVATSSSNATFSMPEDLAFNLDLDIQNLKYARFEAENVTGQLIYLDKVARAKRVRMRSSEGILKGGLRLDGNFENKYHLTTTTEIQDMNIESLFYQFENFGQSVVDQKNIKGRITADIQLDCFLDANLNVISNSISSLADISVKKGELINLSALKEVTEYFRIKRIAGKLFQRNIDDIERRLSHIKFSELDNQVSVKNGVVTFPNMLIKSSAMDLHMAGTHSFKNEIDYAFDFKLRDLKVQKEDLEYSEVSSDGGVKLFIRMYGTVDNPQFEVNKLARKAHVQQKVENEKLQAKAVLQENLGLFKKDTTLKVEEAPREKVEFILYEGELEEDDDIKKEPERKRKRDNKTRANKFYDKLLKQKEETRDSVVIEFGG